MVYQRSHLVDHTSTDPANPGQRVQLSLKEWLPSERTDSVVLMLHGRSVPGVPVFAFGNALDGWERYNWAYKLARSGIQVYVMDLQGFGGSTRPDVMNHARNAWINDQGKLAPYPLIQPYPAPPYPYKRHLMDSNSGLQELLTVLNWITHHRPGLKVHLVGYSAGAFTVGRFAMTVPERVASLFLLAPVFPPWGFSNEPANPPRNAFGFPMYVQTKDDMMVQWNNDRAEGARREPGIEDQLWQLILAQDAVGAGWGNGVIRFPNTLRWGWNPSLVESNRHLGSTVPVAIVYGASDTQAITRPEVAPSSTPQEPHAGPPFNCKWLYRSITNPNKLMISIPNTGHFIPWETSYEVLHRYSADWIKYGSVKQGGPRPIGGYPWIKQGSYELKPMGRLAPAPDF